MEWRWGHRKKKGEKKGGGVGRVDVLWAYVLQSKPSRVERCRQIKEI